MFNQVIAEASSLPSSAEDASGDNAIWSGALRRFMRVAHHTLMVMGIAAIGAITLLFVKPEAMDHLRALSPFTEAQAAKTVTQVPQPATPLMLTAEVPATISSQQLSDKSHVQRERVVNWISKRYRVASDATNMLVSAVYQTADELKLDPLLILAVMAIESRFNPFAESPVGAQGLMQVMSKVHREKFENHGGVKAALNPVANIKVGAQILKNYVQRGGSVEAGLKLYVGAGALDTDFGYGAKVLSEYARLKDVAMGKKVSIYATTVRKPLPAKPKTEPVEATTVEQQATPTPEVEKVAAL